jgi:hypothetical protein
MPNWCDNRLTVTGPERSLINFREAAKSGGEPFSLEPFLPLPEELEPNDYHGDQWHDYRIATFGTKWDVSDARLEAQGSDSLEYYFTSAWGPPDNAMQNISREFPDLRFGLWYEETGAYFRGEVIYQNGEVVDQQDLTEEMAAEDKSEDQEEENGGEA